MKFKLSYLIITILLAVLFILFYQGYHNSKPVKPILFSEQQLGLPVMSIPNDNQLSEKKVALGRKIFMDRRLSHNNTISCAMCHVPEQGFTSNELATAVGIEGRTGRRNSPTILNAGYIEKLFHDGRESSLENQVISPLTAFNEMGNPSIGYVIDKVRSLADYKNLFEDAFNGPVSLERFSQALAAYERTLVSGNSRFDQWYYGKNKNALNQNEIDGFKLFTGKAGCVSCHTLDSKAAVFTDQSFHNTGIGWSRNNAVNNKIFKEKKIKVRLAPGVEVVVDQNHFDDASEAPQNDVGRFEITEDPKDSWAYKTPSLRNVEITGPYMHDGSLLTLEDVIDFYNVGGEDNPYKDRLMRPLGLTSTEKESLVSFLKALTGSNVKQLEKDARSAYVADVIK